MYNSGQVNRDVLLNNWISCEVYLFWIYFFLWNTWVFERITFSPGTGQPMFTIWRPGKKNTFFAEHLQVATSDFFSPDLLRYALIIMVAFLQNNLPLQSSLVKEVSCLSPNSKQTEWARNPAGRLPNLITQREEPLVNDQSKLYQEETIPAECTTWSVQIRSYFWSVFSSIRIEYEPEITPHLDTFHAVMVRWYQWQARKARLLPGTCVLSTTWRRH